MAATGTQRDRRRPANFLDGFSWARGRRPCLQDVTLPQRLRATTKIVGECGHDQTSGTEVPLRRRSRVFREVRVGASTDRFDRDAALHANSRTDGVVIFFMAPCKSLHR